MNDIPHDFAFAAVLASLDDPDTLTAWLDDFARAEADTLAWIAADDTARAR